MSPTGPLIYRFYELIQSYGMTWKAFIEEEFGDGIRVRLTYQSTIHREPDPKSDRVRIEIVGQISAIQMILKRDLRRYGVDLSSGFDPHSAAIFSS